MWFSHRVGEYAFFIVECWSGDLQKKSYHHLFEARVKLTKIAEDLDTKLLGILEDIAREVTATSGVANLQAYVLNKVSEAKQLLGEEMESAET